MGSVTTPPLFQWPGKRFFVANYSAFLLDLVGYFRQSAASQLLNRPATVTKPDVEEIDMSSVSETLKKKNIEPSDLKFGFLGLGIMGSGIVKNLINSGHQVTIWNRTATKCRKFVEAGAQQAPTPSDVVDAADITFSCVSDPLAVKEVNLN